jgi:reductive dehalogenase
MVAGILIPIAAMALAGQAFLALAFFISSIWEKEKRASVFAGLQLLVMAGLVIVFLLLMRSGFFETRIGGGILIGGIIFGVLTLFALMKKTPANQKALKGTKGLIVGEVKRHDEREIVFARNRSLRPGSEQYKAFYRNHPEYEEYDAKRRIPGGISGRFGKIDIPFEGPNVAATLASHIIPLSLSTVDKVNPAAAPVLRGRVIPLSPEEATARVKGFAGHLGADLVGVTEINPLWIYSHRGEIFHENWEDWGKEIEVGHTYAVVFAMEMSLEMIGPAPHTTATIESNCNYAKGAYIAAQLASFISNLGYPATANHFRHYEEVLVPLAVDAGLGELGRIGFLVTREFGPRVRLGAVTTDLPLIPDQPVDIGVADFCRICKKCALCCPSGSIPSDDTLEVNGTLRWKLNAESCFEYWGKVGTGCNICMRVCLWSHARTFPHQMIVGLVSRNMIARRLFSHMDDIYYGKRPKPKAPPKWAHFDAPGSS